MKDTTNTIFQYLDALQVVRTSRNVKFESLINLGAIDETSFSSHKYTYAEREAYLVVAQGLRKGDIIKERLQDALK